MTDSQAVLTPVAAEGQLDTYLSYIPCAHIDFSGSFGFRSRDPEPDAALRSSLQRMGQTHPIILERHADDRFTILDGHRRAAAICEVRAAGGDWEKMWAHVVPAGALSPLNHFRVLRDRNLWGENPYRLTETGRFFAASMQTGLTIEELAAESHMAESDVAAHLKLGRAHPELARLLDDSPLSARQAVLLMDRFDACLRSAYASHAPDIARLLVLHADQEPLSDPAWNFLLDFYWGQHRPFLPGRLVSF